MPPNKNTKKRAKSNISQEERRRLAANKPLGGYGPPKGYNARLAADYDTGRNNKGNQRIVRIMTIVMAVIMLLALMGSLLVGCIDTTSRTALAADVNLSGVAAPNSTAANYSRVRYLKRDEAPTISTASLLTPAEQLPDGTIYRGETGHYIKGSLLTFWQTKGATAAFGNPISEEFLQNGRVAQYFERSLLEYYPDQKGTKIEVQIGFLGRQLAEAQGLKFSPTNDTSSSPTRSYFKETGQSLSGLFKAYWDKNSGLELLGFPIGEAYSESSGLTVQYFERGRLEAQGSNPAQMSNSGDLLLEAKGWARPIKLPMDLNIADTEIYQGRTLSIRLGVNGQWLPTDVQAHLGENSLKVEKVAGIYKSLNPIGPATDPKTYPLVIDFTDPAARPRRINQLITIVKYNFPLQRLYIPAEKNTALDPVVQTAEEKLLQPIYNLYSTQPLWSGLWGLPSPNANEANITTQFAERRAYNDSPTYDSFHGGIDYAEPTGSPIWAPTTGKVVFADNLIVRGGTVIIDHGMGVISLYFHMSQIIATKGQSVKPGDLLGRVGTTGLSSGPHLHWEVRVNGLITDPRLFQKQDLSK